MLDGFFAAILDTASPRRELSDRAFAKARDHLHLPALVSLNDLVVRRADEAGLIERWHGLRVVAGDAVRRSLRTRSAAAADQRLFALFLPGAELTLHASVHSALVGERSMLVEALDLLGPDDPLVLDRGYPANWLVALLNARAIRFVMRCDNDSGWSAPGFLRSGAAEARMTLSAPSSGDVRDWGCPAERHRLVWLVRSRPMVRFAHSSPTWTPHSSPRRCSPTSTSAGASKRPSSDSSIACTSKPSRACRSRP